MNKVSIQYIEELVSPLIGQADNDSFFDTYNNISYTLDGNDEEIVKMILEKEILTNWKGKEESIKSKFKNSLSYYLTTDKINFERLFNSNLFPFNPPDTPKKNFVWLWEVIFNFESYIIKDLGNYLVIDC